MIQLNYRKACIEDLDLYFKWSNDPLVRQNSFNQTEIPYSDHVRWFTNKLKDERCHFYLFLDSNFKAVGQVRIDKFDDEIIIGLSIDEHFRGKGLGPEMLNLACIDYKKFHPDEIIVAYIKEGNISSYKVFEKAGFGNGTKIMVKNGLTYRLIKK
ncbi:GNAT family N-acetyltransferase [Pedobacter hiemivivus]|uniref:GNAT family N-acetyltransferase n=1 Tax=Pedobacter hiemivivus TaxID=2530454 RepID=A0A4U1G0F8_9SPHI|nr:GNAT family N-acetyltransferase [Pedobacter hiemivivus]TKC56947.1 GNAT family N-acetyltransferase [Pedobacter hiemivivus]